MAKMTLDKAERLMRIEKECVTRADACDRRCDKCELVQDTGELLSAYDFVLAMFEIIRKWEDTENDDGK